MQQKRCCIYPAALLPCLDADFSASKFRPVALRPTLSSGLPFSSIKKIPFWTRMHADEHRLSRLLNLKIILSVYFCENLCPISLLCMQKMYKIFQFLLCYEISSSYVSCLLNFLPVKSRKLPNDVAAYDNIWQNVRSSLYDKCF